MIRRMEARRSFSSLSLVGSHCRESDLMCLEPIHGCSGEEEEEEEELNECSRAYSADDLGKMEQCDGNRLCRSLAKSLADVRVTESLADQNTAYRRRPLLWPPTVVVWHHRHHCYLLCQKGSRVYFLSTSSLDACPSSRRTEAVPLCENISATENSPSFVCFHPLFFLFLLF